MTSGVSSRLQRFNARDALGPMATYDDGSPGIIVSGLAMGADPSRQHPTAKEGYSG
jgi:hypothetical protein